MIQSKVACRSIIKQFLVDIGFQAYAYKNYLLSMAAVTIKINATANKARL